MGGSGLRMMVDPIEPGVIPPLLSPIYIKVPHRGLNLGLFFSRHEEDPAPEGLIDTWQNARLLFGMTSYFSNINNRDPAPTVLLP